MCVRFSGSAPIPPRMPKINRRKIGPITRPRSTKLCRAAPSSLPSFARSADSRHTSRCKSASHRTESEGAKHTRQRRRQCLFHRSTQFIFFSPIITHRLIATEPGMLRTQISGLIAVLDEFLQQCRSAGLTPANYPFNTADRTLSLDTNKTEFRLRETSALLQSGVTKLLCSKVFWIRMTIVQTQRIVG